MEGLLLTIAAIVVMAIALRLLASAWVRSSPLGGYHVSHGQDGLDRGPQAREDDDARWNWIDRKPKT